MVPCLPKLRTKLRLVVTLGCLLSNVTIAQQIKTRTSYAPGVNFSKYHTYRWVEAKGQHPESTLDAQIKQAVDSQLATKGLTRTTGATADLDIDYQAAISQTEVWRTYNGWSTTSETMQQPPEGRESTIDMGTLVIDMYDTEGKLLVWTGRAHKAIEVNSSQEERQKNLNKAAQQLLTSFPPK